MRRQALRRDAAFVRSMDQERPKNEIPLPAPDKTSSMILFGERLGEGVSHAVDR